MLVDGGADDHDHVLGGADNGRVGRGGQPAGRHRALALAHPHVVPLIVTQPLATPLGLRPAGTPAPPWKTS